MNKWSCTKTKSQLWWRHHCQSVKKNSVHNMVAQKNIITVPIHFNDPKLSNNESHQRSKSEGNL